MAIQFRADQQLYRGKGPLDPKSLVKTYEELIKLETWTDDNTSNGTFIAYNGMITAVWLNKADTSKNGVYLLFDPSVTSALKKPDVTNENNWHKFVDMSELDLLSQQIAAIQNDLQLFDNRIASLEEDKVIISRDNEYNYKQKTPLNNEICLVDVAGQGIRVKIGDGKTPFTELSYIDDAVLYTVDNIIVKGYYNQNKFYKDSTHNELLSDIKGRIYIDVVTSRTYMYDGTDYVSNSVNSASSTIAGVVKLYDSLGKNTDGAMTQRAVSDELNQKIEVEFIKDQEMLVFDNDFEDNI